MPCKVRLLCERFVTNIAFEWFFSSVNHYMPFKVSLICEGFATNVAFERFFTSMSHHMPIKVRLIWEGFSTNVMPSCSMSVYSKSTQWSLPVPRQYKENKIFPMEYTTWSWFLWLLVLAVIWWWLNVKLNWSVQYVVLQRGQILKVYTAVVFFLELWNSLKKREELMPLEFFNMVIGRFHGFCVQEWLRNVFVENGITSFSKI